MPDEKDRERDTAPQPGHEDQLSPSRALCTVSFPEGPDDEGEDESDDGGAEELEARGEC
jgi:hypothetical protein